VPLPGNGPDANPTLQISFGFLFGNSRPSPVLSGCGNLNLPGNGGRGGLTVTVNGTACGSDANPKGGGDTNAHNAGCLQISFDNQNGCLQISFEKLLLYLQISFVFLRGHKRNANIA